ncbi:MAG: signal recognition particle-docking protein FtsY [Candidatus Bipolaricaulota bacterium]
MNWFKKLSAGLKKTRNNFIGKIKDAIDSYSSIEPDLMEEIEELLVTSDIGIKPSMEIVERLEQELEEAGEKDPSSVEKFLKKELKERLEGSEKDLEIRRDGEPTVILVMGVNGSGKTTTIAKLGKKLMAEGKQVVLAASDTFRAAAIEQLEKWGGEIEATTIKHDIGADPSAVAYDALEHTLNQNADALFIDTAGRLQTKHNLMEELKKINRVLEKRLGRPIDERLLVIDATNGQNAISQAEKFNEAISVTGIVLTKLDGTAKGGALFPIFRELELPIKFIGVGEGEDDLHQFDKDEFIEALFQ